jgi:hypothetical protein
MKILWEVDRPTFQADLAASRRWTDKGKTMIFRISKYRRIGWSIMGIVLFFFHLQIAIKEK